ncbi:MAG: FKBP-type peptidyl-prolyl cis-trans isomerase [Bacteroidetes bacterium]|nr:FKBP-type peptidyl-prolyl cis-trans isomerase [Bacteroidota bacterium]
MNKNLFYIIAFAFYVLQSCFDKKSENSYKTSDVGFEYKYHIESKSQKFPQDSTMLFLQIRMFNERDSVLFDSRDVAPQFKDWFFTPVPADMPLHSMFAIMQEGDSMSFLFNARDYHRRINPHSVYIDSFAEHEKLRFEIKLEKIATEDEIITNLAKRMADKKLEEEFLLAEYIERNYPAAVPTASGMYFIQERQGSGNFAKPTDKVIIHYTVSYINGEPIYSTYKKVNPLKVKVNNPLLFPCLTEGLQKMRRGGRAIIIAPSKIAAGERGDAEQGIAPYTTLIFDVELLKIGN